MPLPGGSRHHTHVACKHLVAGETRGRATTVRHVVGGTFHAPGLQHCRSYFPSTRLAASCGSCVPRIRLAAIWHTAARSLLVSRGWQSRTKPLIFMSTTFDLSAKIRMCNFDKSAHAIFHVFTVQVGDTIFSDNIMHVCARSYDPGPAC